MSVAGVANITAGSPQSFEDAINASLSRANATLDHIEAAWIRELKVVVKGGKVREYRVSLRLTYVRG